VPVPRFGILATIHPGTKRHVMLFAMASLRVLLAVVFGPFHERDAMPLENLDCHSGSGRPRHQKVSQKTVQGISRREVITGMCQNDIQLSGVTQNFVEFITHHTVRIQHFLDNLLVVVVQALEDAVILCAVVPKARPVTLIFLAV
jgi:hypothetical protein